MDARKAIIDLVNRSTGIKATELVADLALRGIDGYGHDIFNELVRDGEIVELEYVLPSMSYRIKSIYFPKGTEIRIP